MKLTHTLFTAAILAAISVPQPSLAQNFSSDARKIGMGGAGDSENIASQLVEEHQNYRAIGLPLGIIQLIRHRNIFNPDHADFDPARAIEYAADPLHITMNRDSATAASRFVENLVDAGLSRDLNTYRGFTPPERTRAAGLYSPTWGKTIRFSKDATTGAFHGIYVGVGPYLAVDTDLTIDPQLLDILASPVNKYVPGANFKIGNVSSGQGAASITGGYRGRYPIFKKLERGDSREGVYVAANYHYLHGIHYDTATSNVQFDTDAQGNITLTPTTTPVVVNRTTSKSGNGFALDFATAVVTEHWDATFGVDGVGNRINWKELAGRRYTLQSLFNGGDFIQNAVTPSSSEAVVKLPVRYSTAVGYHSGRWSAASEFAHTLQGFSSNIGGEYLWKRFAIRGGGRYTRDKWHPAVGAGVNLTNRIGVDVAMLENTTNIQRDYRPSFAFSLRLNKTTEN